MKYVLGIDIGTTNVKAVLFEPDGSCGGSVNQPYPTSYPSAGRVEQNPEDWYCAVIRAIGALLKMASISSRDILCIGFSGQIRSIAFLDAAFQPLCPSIVWSDTRSASEVAQLNSDMQNRLIQITGNRAATNFALPNILWMSKHHPDIFASTRYLATPKDYVIYRLTGQFISDASNQSGSLLVDIHQQDWSDELLDYANITRESLPRLARSIDRAGSLTRLAAEESGLPEGLTVVLGGGDNDCAAIGSGAYEAGTAAISLGTSGIVLTRTDAPLLQAAGKLDIFTHVIPDRYYAMGMIKSAGQALEWLKKRLVDETSSLLGANPPLTMTDWLASMLGDRDVLVPGNDGLFLFPYFQGRGNPDKHSSARAVIWGMTGSHTNRHLAQAAMEGVGYAVRQCLDSIAEWMPLQEIICCGKGSANAVWMKMIANILGKPVWTNTSTEVSSLGAAILAATGIGLFASVEEACRVMAKKEKQYLPSETAIREYENCYNRFLELSALFWSKE